MSFVDKIKDAFSNKDELAAEEAARQAQEAAQREAAEREAQQKRDEAEAREAADRDAEKAREEAAEAERLAAEQRAADERAAEEQRAAEQRAAEERAAAEAAAAATPALSVGRVREVVAHDSNPSTPTGEGLDKGLGMVLESALRRALDQLGLPNRNTDDGSLGTMFLESYSRWQGHLGYSGNDADGVPGRESLTKLAEFTNAFRVVD